MRLVQHIRGRLLGGAASLTVIASLIGCGSSKTPPPETTPETTTTDTLPQVAPKFTGDATVAEPTTETTPADTSTPDKLVKAEAGLGEKGHYEDQNILTVSVAARFRTEERLLLGQIEQGLAVFKATEGRKPKSHEEFMTKIIKQHGYRLPELPEGQSYFYDPDRGTNGELMVRIPQ